MNHGYWRENKMCSRDERMMNISKRRVGKKEYAIINGAFELNTIRASLIIINGVEQTKWRLPNRKEISDILDQNPDLLNAAYRRFSEGERVNIIPMGEYKETDKWKKISGKIAYWTEEFVDDYGTGVIYMPEEREFFNIKSICYCPPHFNAIFVRNLE